MEGKRVFVAAEDGVIASEAGDCWAILSGAEVVLVYLAIIVLTGEHKAVIDGCINI